jgi:hypothetical protein
VVKRSVKKPLAKRAAKPAKRRPVLPLETLCAALQTLRRPICFDDLETILRERLPARFVQSIGFEGEHTEAGGTDRYVEIIGAGETQRQAVGRWWGGFCRYAITTGGPELIWRISPEYATRRRGVVAHHAVYARLFIAGGMLFPLDLPARRFENRDQLRAYLDELRERVHGAPFMHRSFYGR